MFLSASGIAMTCEQSFICLLVESWPVIGHEFVC